MLRRNLYVSIPTRSRQFIKLNQWVSSKNNQQ
jgi:hypothetical protein